MATVLTPTSNAKAPESAGMHAPPADAERARWDRHPLSRWVLCPLADLVARHAGRIGANPLHFTIANLLLASSAAACLMVKPNWSIAAAAMTALAWFCDRIDGMLARRQQTTSLRGAWLDANIDELCDVLLHVGVAAAAVAQTGNSTGWLLVVAFIAGKYLFSFGIYSEREVSPVHLRGGINTADRGDEHSRLSRLYHLAGNADVRVHLLIAACLLQWWTAELVYVAVYFNLRWLVRYPLVVRRLQSSAAGRT